LWREGGGIFAIAEEGEGDGAHEIGGAHEGSGTGATRKPPESDEGGCRLRWDWIGYGMQGM
jgi:hypothetical protein